MHDALTPEEAAEELRLWADYYEATGRALDLVRTGGTKEKTLSVIAAEHAKATAAMRRIKEIRGLSD